MCISNRFVWIEAWTVLDKSLLSAMIVKKKVAIKNLPYFGYNVYLLAKEICFNPNWVLRDEKFVI